MGADPSHPYFTKASVRILVCRRCRVEIVGVSACAWVDFRLQDLIIFNRVGVGVVRLRTEKTID